MARGLDLRRCGERGVAFFGHAFAGAPFSSWLIAPDDCRGVFLTPIFGCHNGSCGLLPDDRANLRPLRLVAIASAPEDDDQACRILDEVEKCITCVSAICKRDTADYLSS